MEAGLWVKPGRARLETVSRRSVSESVRDAIQHFETQMAGEIAHLRQGVSGVCRRNCACQCNVHKELWKLDALGKVSEMAGGTPSAQ
jgi:hypothetical protein